MKNFKALIFDEKEKNYSILYEQDGYFISSDLNSLDFKSLKELAVQNSKILNFISKIKVENWSELENLIVSIKDLSKENRIKFIYYLDTKKLFDVACDFSYFIHKVYKIDVTPEEVVSQHAELEKENRKISQHEIIKKIVENNKSSENNGNNEDFKFKNNFKRDKTKNYKNNERTK